MVELLSSYSNPDIVSRLERVVAGAGRDRPSARTVRPARQQQRKLSSDEVDALVGCYDEGCAIHLLSRDFGIHRTTVSAHLKARGVWKSPRRLTDREAAEVVQLYQDGWSQARTAQHFGVSSSMVARVLKQAGVASRQVGTNQWSGRS